MAAVLVLVTGVGADVAIARAPAGCLDPADSALNQYCETYPAASGGQMPQVGTPALAKTLPPQVVARIGTGSGPAAHARRQLLSLPAAERAPKRPGNGLARASASTLPVWLILVLIALAVALVTGAAQRHRRARSPGPRGGDGSGLGGHSS
jgi:hypothetical protein